MSKKVERALTSSQWIGLKTWMQENAEAIAQRRSWSQVHGDVSDSASAPDGYWQKVGRKRLTPLPASVKLAWLLYENVAVEAKRWGACPCAK